MDNIKSAAVCGSFCTYEKMLLVMQAIRTGSDVTPIMSKTQQAPTRFGTASHFISSRRICGKVLSTIESVEYIGPKRSTYHNRPCTGNTLAKIAAG